MGLRDNSALSLSADVLEIGGSDIFLGDCGRLCEGTAGTVPDTLEHAWRVAALSCSKIALWLSGGATYLGDMYCRLAFVWGRLKKSEPHE